VIIGFANGCFDKFHEGHRHFLTSCREHCEYLIVAVNSDEWCRQHKGPDRPVDDVRTRMMHVRQLAEAAIPFDGYEEGLIVHIRPNFLFRGYDHPIRPERGTCQVANGIGCAIVKIAHLPGYSTTELIHAAQ